MHIEFTPSFQNRNSFDFGRQFGRNAGCVCVRPSRTASTKPATGYLMEGAITAVSFQTTSGKVKAPVAYGQYELGRSSRPKNQKYPNHKGSPWSVDGMLQQVPLPGTNVHYGTAGDPGQYEPYMYEDAGTNPLHNSNQSAETRKPFDSTEVRVLRSTLFGLETPSVGQYPVFLPEKTMGQIDDNIRYPKQDANVSVFKSGSLQRPDARSKVPAGAEYSPNMGSIQPVIGNPWASSKNAADRFHEAKFKYGTGGTTEIVGPGSYVGADFEKTLLEDCQEHIRRSSALKIPFQSTSPQRPGFFMNPGQSPDIAPGCYEPLEPRLKDLMASGGDWRQVM